MSCFVDVVRPGKRPFALAFDFLTVMGGSFLIALLAQISIPLGFTPVPLTLQTLGVLLIGGVLGRKKGTWAVLAYLSQGAMGLPFFAGGTSGLSALMGPTGGYFLGFIVATSLVGYLLERGPKEKLSYSISTMCVGAFCILFFGALWLSFFVGGMQMAIALGVIPFLLGEGIKVVTAAVLIPTGWKFIHSHE
jgi:biotin transport system substrate-specific component